MKSIRLRYDFLPFALLWLALASPVCAQQFGVLWSFDGDNGLTPVTPLLDRAGNIYGTTLNGGSGYGNVYKLTHSGSSWIFHNLYTFNGVDDGCFPGALTVGPDGALYGTTSGCGIPGVGSVFKLAPPPTFCRSVICPWDITVLYTFTAGFDSGMPNGNVVFDSAGNMYGTAWEGGQYGLGTVWELSRSGQTWTETVLYSFDGPHGSYPASGVIFDGNGNLYGTTLSGGANNSGEVYKLSRSGSSWTAQVLYSFVNGQDGSSPNGGLVFDAAGNLYGSTQYGGQSAGGTLFELSPSSGNWAFNLLYSLIGTRGPRDHLTLDASGNLYGTTYADGAQGLGSVFELSRSGAAWIFSDLHDFAGGDDGKHPRGSLALDDNLNIYGTAAGGINTGGIVFEISR